jgi:hypothetical protein
MRAIDSTNQKPTVSGSALPSICDMRRRRVTTMPVISRFMERSSGKNVCRRERR